MAKGIKYTNQPLGTFDGLCHYVDKNGFYIVKGKGGAKGSVMKNNPDLIRTRENYTEYGICAKWTHLVRMNLSDIVHLCYNNYTSWINQMGKNIQKMDTEGPRGHRGVKSSQHKSLLTSLNFNEQHLFKHVLTREPEVVVSEDRKTITVNIPQFYSNNELIWSRPFLYYRFTLQIGQLADYLWDDEGLKFAPEYPNAEDYRIVVRGDWMSKSTNPLDISLTASFAETKLPAENITVTVGLGIEIGSNEAPGTISFSKGDGTMALIACL